ncbi:MAG: class I SAM-dependent methyltransferase [Thaumarchaeota archaeon]|nr:class I SAM-dependent methyltransferase [Nitrososphaerota archaeon]MCS4540203.1 class I SAM-dependent methyltransferase [Nitrososphaerota archaeon]
MHRTQENPPLLLSPDRGIQRVAKVLFRGLSPTYDLVLDYATLFQDRRWKKWLVEAASIERNWRVLDLGCGTCILERYLSKEGCKVTGLDLTEEMLRVAQAKKIGCVESLFVGDAEQLPYAESAFDAVLSCYVAKYCDERKLVKEVRRVLKPGGSVTLYDFSTPRGVFAPFHAFYVYGIMRILGWFFSQFDGGIGFTFTNLPEIIRARRWEERLFEILRKEGFIGLRRKNLSGGVVTALQATKAQIT